MAPEITLLTEADTALLARVGLLLGVDALVPGQVRLYAECLAAHFARMILLTRVHSQMIQHLLPPAESFGAVDTLVRVFIRMGLAVYIQGRLGLERLATGVAHVRSLARVNTPMILHRCFHGEAASTYVTGVILHAVVHMLQMIVQTAVLDKLLAAYVARVRLLACVHTRVRPITLSRAKFLTATLADQYRIDGGSTFFGLLGQDLSYLLQTRVRFTHLVLFPCVWLIFHLLCAIYSNLTFRISIFILYIFALFLIC